MLDSSDFQVIDLDPNPNEAIMAELPEDIEYFLANAIVLAIKHTRKFFLTRKSPPSIAEQVGEFVNGLRRQLKDSDEKLYLEFIRILDVSMWWNVAHPSNRNTYKWDFIVSTKSGNYKMNHSTASRICQGANVMAQNKSIDEEFLEINSILNNLLKEKSVLDNLVYCAKDLNTKADVVVDNLCSIAEKLQED